MKPSSILALTILLTTSPTWLCDNSYAETVLNKCTDGKQITYTDKPCEKLGLTGAGPISNSVTETLAAPATQVRQNKSHEDNDFSDAATIKPVKLLLDKSL